jgi:hypothetical protein
MWQVNTHPLPSRAGRYDASIRRHARRSAKANDRAVSHGVLGYPATWPAGPWVVPLFWLLAVFGAWLLRLFG